MVLLLAGLAGCSAGCSAGFSAGSSGSAFGRLVRRPARRWRTCRSRSFYADFQDVAGGGGLGEGASRVSCATHVLVEIFDHDLVRCPRQQLGAPACACWLELVHLTEVSDHAGDQGRLHVRRQGPAGQPRRRRGRTEAVRSDKAARRLGAGRRRRGKWRPKPVPLRLCCLPYLNGNQIAGPGCGPLEACGGLNCRGAGAAGDCRRSTLDTRGRSWCCGGCRPGQLTR